MSVTAAVSTPQTTPTPAPAPNVNDLLQKLLAAGIIGTQPKKEATPPPAPTAPVVQPAVPEASDSSTSLEAETVDTPPVPIAISRPKVSLFPRSCVI